LTRKKNVLISRLSLGDEDVVEIRCTQGVALFVALGIEEQESSVPPDLDSAGF